MEGNVELRVELTEGADMADVIACRRIYFHIQALSAAAEGAAP